MSRCLCHCYAVEILPLRGMSPHEPPQSAHHCPQGNKLIYRIHSMHNRQSLIQFLIMALP